MIRNVCEAVGYDIQYRAKRMLQGVLQNLEMGHPTQKSLTHTGRCRGCRTVTIALPRLILVQVCQISSNQLFLGVVLSSFLLRLFSCAISYSYVGESAAILRTSGPISCCMVSAFFCVTGFLGSIM